MALRHRHRRVAERKEYNPAYAEEGSEDGVKATWIELNFKKRECIKFVPSFTHEGFQRCGCGRLLSAHDFLDSGAVYEDAVFSTSVELQNEITFYEKRDQSLDPDRRASGITKNELSPKRHKIRRSQKVKRQPSDAKWNVTHHTTALPTDAYGTLEYQGTGEGDKSQYIRLAHDTHPELVLRLLTEEWGLQRPKMVITVHGGVHNFQLQPKLKRVFCDGLIKAAKTTGAWIMLFGLNTGVGSVVGDALKDHKARSRGKIYSIGVAPWGVVDNREDLVGPQAISSYQTMTNPLSKGAVLNAAHTHFLLVDNGTEGKYGSELKFRRRLERKLSLLQITQKHSRKIPVVCLVLEGGKNTINVVLESVRQNPPIPVIVVDGSGRAADLIAFAHQYADDNGTMMEDLRLQLLITIQNTFACEREQAQFIYLTILECVRRKDLITVFRLGQGQSKNDDIDKAILTASLKAKRTSAPDMLTLALAWNRIDIATSQIFVYGQHWPVLSLEQAMMDALIQDRTDFVKLLMENGVSVHKFLTIPRLEELYNIKQIPVHLLYLLQDVKKNITFGCRFNLIEIGQLIESLMGGAYRCNYTRKRFRLYYAAQGKCNVRKQGSFTKHLLPGSFSKLDMSTSFRDEGISTSHCKIENKDGRSSPQCLIPKDFQYPFHELMVWAVLMKRQKMALFMWEHGEEAIAKALVAAKLYKAMAREAADDELDLEEMEELKRYSSEFRDLAIQLLEICYRADTDATQHLLTYELKQWSKHTCLSLAIAAQHREFIAHPCVQLQLNDLWMGGLNVRKNSSLRVILGLLVPPSIFKLQFKSLEELQLMPQTMEEHMDERNDSSSISSSSSSSLSSSTSSSSSSSTSGSITSGLQPKPEVVGRGLDHSNHLPEDAYRVFAAQQRQLSVSKKVYEFYNAPITKFWLYTMSYIVFLLMFTYVVLVSMSSMPSPVEWVIIAHIFTLTLEKIREIAASEPSGAFNKIKLWLGHFWHCIDIVLLLMFFVGFGLRMAQRNDLMNIGRALYCVNVSLWYIRLLNIFSVSKYLGPYVMMMGKMMVDLGTFIILVAVVLISFGVTRQALLHPKEIASWSLVRDVLLEPYFMLYGEVYAGTIDPCSDENFDTLCVVGSWIVPTAMTLYLLVANILLLNMLIAVFNNTFTKVKNISDKIWKFHRYGVIVEYEFRPMLPPPFIVLSYVVMLIRLCFKKRKNLLFNSDRGLKLFLDDEDVEKLHDFEEDCLDDLFRQRGSDNGKNSGEDLNKVAPGHVERLLDHIDESGEHNNAVTLQLNLLEERLMQLEETNTKILRILPQLADIQLNGSDIGQSERNSDEASFISMRERMRFRLGRIRQDSEMSTFSDWHPSSLLLRRFKSQHTEERKRHASERVVDVNATEYKIRKTNSTGNIQTSNPQGTEPVMISTTVATASSHNIGSSQAVTKLFIDPEQKSVSCQDLLMMKEVQKAPEENLKSADSIISGSEFLPSDYVDDNTPVEFKRYRFGGSSKRGAQRQKLRFFDDEQNLLPATTQTADRGTGGVADHTAPELCCDMSGNESSCSSMSYSDDNAKSRSYRGGKVEKKNGKLLKKKRTATIPTLVINSPESNMSDRVTSHSPGEDESGTKTVRSLKLKRGPNSYPLLNLANGAQHTSNYGRRMTDGPSMRLPSTSSKIGSSYKESRAGALTPPGIRVRSSVSSNPNQSLYKSITDCIDTSKWHDINSKSPAPPQTPFELWSNKPAFFAHRRFKSPNFSLDRISLDEWEDEPAMYARQKSSRKNRRHRRSRLYSNNSSSSMKSVSSKRAKARHKRKKKLQKNLTEKLENENRGAISTNACQIQLTTLKENSASSFKRVNETTAFTQSPMTSSALTFNANNSNPRRSKTLPGKQVDDGAISDSFLSRYAIISEENEAALQWRDGDSETRENAAPRESDGGESVDTSPLLC